MATSDAILRSTTVPLRTATGLAGRRRARSRNASSTLLRLMTLEEKVGQLGSRWLGHESRDPAPRAPRTPGPVADLNVAPMQDVFAAAARTARGGGPARARPSDPRLRQRAGHPAEGAAELVRQQRTVLAASRLGIPAIVHEECLTGFTSYGATVYPAAIAWGATFDPDLVGRMAAAIGRDMAALGIHQGLSPVLDVVRDYRWGRVEETMGEDPYLVSVLGAAYVRGLQRPASSRPSSTSPATRPRAVPQPRAGVDGPTGVARRDPPAVRGGRGLGGAASVMNSYSDVDGVPAGADALAAHRAAARDLGLRRAPSSPITGRSRSSPACTGSPPTTRTPARRPSPPASTWSCPTHRLRRARGEGPQRRDPRAAGRPRRAPGAHAEGTAGPARPGLGAGGVGRRRPAWSSTRRRTGRSPGELAERSVVLLEAGSALPLLGAGRPQLRRVAVVGPCADDGRTFMGCYAFPNHMSARFPAWASASRCRPPSRRCGRSCPTSRCARARMRRA